jgi:hypothetical protein
MRRAGHADAAAQRDLAMETTRTVIDSLTRMLARDPDDLWVRVPLLRQRVRMALAEADRGDPVDKPSLTETLAEMAQVRALAHESEWDEAVYRDGQALLAR